VVSTVIWQAGLGQTVHMHWQGLESGLVVTALHVLMSLLSMPLEPSLWMALPTLAMSVESMEMTDRYACAFFVQDDPHNLLSLYDCFISLVASFIWNCNMGQLICLDM